MWRKLVMALAIVDETHTSNVQTEHAKNGNYLRRYS